MVFLQELLQSSLEGLHAEVYLVDCVSRIDVDQVLIFVNAPPTSELASCLLDQLADPA